MEKAQDCGSEGLGKPGLKCCRNSLSWVEVLYNLTRPVAIENLEIIQNKYVRCFKYTEAYYHHQCPDQCHIHCLWLYQQFSLVHHHFH